MGAPAPLLRLGLVPQRHRLQHLDRLADLEAPGRGCHVRIPRHRCRHGSPLALPDGVAEELEQLVRIQPPLRKCRPSDAGAQTAAGRRRPGGGCGGVTLATQLLQPAAPIDDSVSNACRDRSLRGDHSLERAECLLLRVRPLVAPLVSRRIIVHELPAPRRRPFPPLLGGLPEAAACGGGGSLLRVGVEGLLRASERVVGGLAPLLPRRLRRRALWHARGPLQQAVAVLLRCICQAFS
mmetsp:Transcript_146284/g.380211  ORF Transcript_146284/g.380211 Transcript_146284/m.380211 type:complete len:238 (-) Transcript_146284:202-915(-)